MENFIILSLICLLGYFIISYRDEEKKIQKEAITIDCKLLSRNFKGSTLETNIVPAVGMGINGGVMGGVGLVTSGHSEEFISLFDCGKYGILISEDKEIFRKAKENNKLNVYFGEKNYKILDIWKNL